MPSIISRIIGITFATTGLVVILFWLVMGVPVPVTYDEANAAATREGRFFVDVYVSSPQDTARAAQMLKAEGYPAEDTLAGTHGWYGHDFVILKSFRRGQLHAVLIKLTRDIPGALVGASSELDARYRGEVRHGRYNFAYQMFQTIAQVSTTQARAVFYSYAASIICSALLALWLLTLRTVSSAVVRLGLAISCWPLVLSYAYVVTVMPPFEAFRALPLALRLTFDVLAYQMLLFSVYGFAAFWKSFPRAVTDAELDRFLEALKQEQMQSLGATRWFHSPWLGRTSTRGLGGDAGSENPGAAERAGSRSANTWLPLAALSVIALAVGLSWTGGFLIPGQIHLAGIFTVLGVGAITIYYLLFVTPMRLFKYHRVVGSPEDQRKVEWVWVSMLAALVTIVAPLVVLAAVFVGSVFVPSLDAWVDAALLFVAIGTTLAPVLIMLAIGLSIQYRGAIDPKLALRGFTVWTALGVILTLVFVFIERSVALGLVSWLKLPAQSGYVAAGAIVAATFQPVRKYTEKVVNRFVERVLPETLLASGDRQTCAVAVVDLTGYTALAAKDEQVALVASALVQKEARRVSGDRDGRMVKSTGDGVILTFKDAGKCLAAVRELHRAVVQRALAIDLPALSLHSGINFGELVVMRDGAVYGMAVNLAVRIAEWARSGEIGMSEAFRGELSEPPAGLEACGPQRFKNVPEPIVCYRIYFD